MQVRPSLTADRQRFYHEVFACTRLSDQNVVPFVGVYSTWEHTFAPVFGFMEHLNLGECLRNNQTVGKLELVRLPSPCKRPVRCLNILISAAGSSARREGHPQPQCCSWEP